MTITRRMHADVRALGPGASMEKLPARTGHQSRRRGYGPQDGKPDRRRLAPRSHRALLALVKMPAPVCLLLFCAQAPALGQDSAIPEKLKFADALQIAEDANPGYREALSLVDIAQAGAHQAASRPNPSIIFAGEEYSPFAWPSPSTTAGPVFITQLEQEFEPPGQRRRRISAAQAGISLAHSEAADARRVLHVNVGYAYFALVRAQADHATAMEVLHHIEQVITLVEARISAGEVAGMELRRLNIGRLHASDQVLIAQLALEEARSTLLALLGSVDLRQPLIATDSLAVRPLLDQGGQLIASEDGVRIPLDRLREYALDSRPDLSAAVHARKHAEAGVRLARGLRIPSPTVALGYRRHLGEYAMEFGINIPIPIFGGLDRGGVQIVRAEQQRAATLESKATSNITSELRAAVSAANINAERVRAIKQEHLAAVAQLQALVQASYELGEATLMDLLDVQQEFLSAQQLRNGALYDLRISLIELAGAIGVPMAADEISME